MDKHNNFYEMVKDWTVSDFRTPAIKAEVIVDMLISDFIEDLIQYHYSLHPENKNHVKLRVKEFPIKISEENDRNAKVDYLVSLGNETLVLVELKTTNDSFDDPQRRRMADAAEKSKAQELLMFYKKIADPPESENKGNALDRKKYQYIYKNMFSNVPPEKDEEKFKYVEYLYIFLEDNRREVPKLILKNYCEGGECYEQFGKKLEEGQGKVRRLLWEKISKILTECAEKF